jgi:hypothetical protein
MDKNIFNPAFCGTLGAVVSYYVLTPFLQRGGLGWFLGFVLITLIGLAAFFLSLGFLPPVLLNAKNK